MATEKIRVGIIGANVRYGWGSSAHIPALSALPEFEITAVCTSRQETADETAKHFGISRAFADPYKMVQHPDVDLVSICVRVPFHHQMGMAALNAGKHLFCEWLLAATTEQAQQMCDLAPRKGVRHMVGLQAPRSPRDQSRQGPGRRGRRWQGAFVHDDRKDARLGHRLRSRAGKMRDAPRGLAIGVQAASGLGRIGIHRIWQVALWVWRSPVRRGE